MLLLATGIGETEVNELDAVFLHHLDDVSGGHEDLPPEWPREVENLTKFTLAGAARN
jgi:hypothetical protein